jgi:NAD+ kinase
MKTAAIISKPAKPELHEIVPELVHWLEVRDYAVAVDPETAAYVRGPKVVERDLIAAEHPEFVVVLGGDGTLLSAARAVARADIPLLAVNLGSLGFLTEVPLAEMYDTLEAIERKESAVEVRTMLRCELWRDGDAIASYHALNDAVINKGAISRLLNFDLYVDKVFVTNYKADGVIISTPTGSTAYSLASGGPILTPSTEAFVITPVSPHSLTHRPLVVRDESEIEVAVINVEQNAFFSVDGQVGMPVVIGDRVVCRKSEHRVRLMRTSTSFFEILRTKLKWGQR